MPPAEVVLPIGPLDLFSGFLGALLICKAVGLVKEFFQ